MLYVFSGDLQKCDMLHCYLLESIWSMQWYDDIITFFFSSPGEVDNIT